jgi:hypothetical protein
MRSYDGYFLPVAVLDYERPGGVPRLVDVTRSAHALVRSDALAARSRRRPHQGARQADRARDPRRAAAGEAVPPPAARAAAPVRLPLRSRIR